MVLALGVSFEVSAFSFEDLIIRVTRGTYKYSVLEFRFMEVFRFESSGFGVLVFGFWIWRCIV